MYAAGRDCGGSETAVSFKFLVREESMDHEFVNDVTGNDRRRQADGRTMLGMQA